MKTCLFKPHDHIEERTKMLSKNCYRSLILHNFTSFCIDKSYVQL